MTHILERVEARYDVIECEFGVVYKWCPASIVVECGCGERASLTSRSIAFCPGCGEDHEDVLRKELKASGLREEEAKHPWRYAEEREEVTGTVY